MVRIGFLPVLAGLLAASVASAQTTPWQFHWQTGQVLAYRVEQTTSATDEVGEAHSESKTKLGLTKRWQVLSVDQAGVATMQLSLAAMRSETTRPGGEILLYDSTNATAGTAELREALGKYVGPPLALVRIDGYGRVVEVKESKFGPASRFEASLPFQVSFPAVAPKPGQSWERAYVITLEPPQGTGEKYEAVQKYVCKEIKETGAVLELTTSLKTQPEAVADRVPLLQALPEGEIVFDPQSGILRSARLRIDKELKGHQGEGSTYRFQSVYTEEYLGNK